MKAEEASRRASDLSPEKLALLVMRMKKKSAEAPQAVKISRRASAEPPPLSFAQQRLWLLDHLEPGTSAYNMPFPARFTGELDVRVLRSAFDEIVRRHESLRTTFALVEVAGRNGHDTAPVQVISPPAPFHLPLIDLSPLPEPVRGEESQRLLSAEAKTPFDLGRGPLLRAALVRLSPRDHLLLVDMHHIISDGWSCGLFFRELSDLYAAFAEDRPLSQPVLPELPIQYADFAVWQREWLQGEVLEEQLRYWREQLAASPPMLDLPTDRLRPAVQTHHGGSVIHRFPADLTQTLRETSRREGASLFMLLLAGFKLVLSRLAAQDEVVVGAPSAGRKRVETEGLIGFFLNTLVLRTHLAGDPSFRELLGRVKRVVLGAYRFQDVPFEKLLEELQPERHLSRSPLFQVLFNMITVPEARLDLPGVHIDMLPAPEPESKFDFTLYVQEQPDALQIDLVYNADLFDRTRMEEMLRQFEHVMAQAAAEPERRIGDFSLVSPAAAALLPDPAAALGGEWMGAVHHALSRHAEENPEAPAVSDWRGERWSRGELEARSNQLAWYLQASGVRTGDVVAVWAHRSASLVWAVMGTLKAGAAFMILDPAYPTARLLDYLEIGRPAGWLAVEGAAAPPAEVEEALRAAGCRCRLDLPPLSAAAERGLLANFPPFDPGVPVTADDAAVITFTSGSTGKPKGVVGRHGPLSHFYPWMARRFDLSDADRFGMLSALSHDPLQRDLFTPVWLGGSIHIPDPERISAPGYLSDWARSEGVTMLHLTPAMMEILLGSAEERGEELPELRRALVVGDLLKRSDVARLQGLCPNLMAVNLYGSTETQRSVACFEVPRPEVCPAGPLDKLVLPLGRGMQDVQLLILNRAQKLCGVGEVGEIYMRSRHLARGYLGDEALTTARFLPNPFAPESEGDRVYKTGDLGRYLPDGNAEFAGRADFQVKIRGFRIELGEIEAALDRFPGVKECVVVAREDRPGERRLAAYLVVDGEAPSARELRAFLEECLPDYMVPSAFVALAALPLTQTGKIDRKALPAPDSAWTDLGRDFVAPRNQIEEMLAGVWAEALRRERVGVYDNFFELGGDSILILQVVSKSQKRGLRFAPRQLFQHQTVAELAEVVDAADLLAARAEDSGPVPLTPPQARFLEAAGSCCPGGWSEALLVELPAGVTAEQVELSLAALAAGHDAFRLRFERLTPEGGCRQSLAAPNCTPLIPLDRCELPADPAEREAALAERIAEVRGRLDLTAGPVARAAFFSGVTGPDRLLLAAHPLVMDGSSWPILLTGLAETCGRLQRADSGEPLEDGPRTTSFRRWAGTLAERAQSTAGLAAMEEWSAALRPAPPRLPVDLRDAGGDGERRALSVWLDEATTRDLQDEVPKHYGNTTQEVLLAALAEAFAPWTGSRRLAVEVEGTGREGLLDGGLDLSRTVGPIDTAFPLHLEVRDNPGESLKEAKERLRQAARRAVDFGLVRPGADARADRLAAEGAEVGLRWRGRIAVRPEGGPLWTAEPLPARRPAEAPRRHLLEVEALLAGSRLRVDWSWDARVHRPETVQALADRFLQALRSLIQHCQTPESAGFTPSDFPEAGLSQADLDDLLTELSESFE